MLNQLKVRRAPVLSFLTLILCTFASQAMADHSVDPAYAGSTR